MSVANAADLSSKEVACQTLSSVDGTSCSTESNNAVSGIIKNGIQILVIIAGIISVIMIIIGGLKYITSSGDAQAVASAKRTLIYAIVGLVIVAFAQVIVQFTLHRSQSATGSTAIASGPEATELARSERILNEALDSNDQSRIDDAEEEYESALQKYESAVDKESKSSTSASSGRSGSSTNSSSARNFTTFKIAAFNILGSEYTDTPGGTKANWPSASTRLPRAMNALKDSRVQVAALQEVYPDQMRILRNKYSDTWGIETGGDQQARVVIWDKSKWRKIKSRNISVPAAGPRNHPFVLLEQIRTGNRIWFMSVQNVSGRDAASTDKREQSLRNEIKAIGDVKRDGHPIFIAGDFNDYFDGNTSAQCLLTPMMTNIFGKGSGRCGRSDADTRVDHIFYMDSGSIRARGANVDQSVMNQRIADHPLVTTSVTAK